MSVPEEKYDSYKMYKQNKSISEQHKYFLIVVAQ